MKTRKIILAFIFISVVCIIVGTMISFSDSNNLIGSDIGTVGYILFGFFMICLLHCDEIAQIMTRKRGCSYGRQKSSKI
jgi:low affinity Fe/Cu permease